MSAHLLHVLLEGSHLFLIAQHAYHVVACHYAQLRVERLYYLQMPVAHTVEYYGVDIL